MLRLLLLLSILAGCAQKTADYTDWRLWSCTCRAAMTYDGGYYQTATDSELCATRAGLELQLEDQVDQCYDDVAAAGYWPLSCDCECDPIGDC